MSDLRKSIFYLQQSIRKNKENQKQLLVALDILCEIELKLHKKEEE
jgi:hypothetical protein